MRTVARDAVQTARNHWERNGNGREKKINRIPAAAAARLFSSLFERTKKEEKWQTQAQNDSDEWQKI